MIRITLCLFLTMLFFSCKLSDKDDIDKAEINGIIRDIQSAFNGRGESVEQKHKKIMSYYRTDFYHDLVKYPTVENFWYKLIIENKSMVIDDVNIKLLEDDSEAKVEFKVTLVDQNDNTLGPFPEPEPGVIIFGYLSYFYYDQTGWKIYGNHRKNE